MCCGTATPTSDAVTAGAKHAIPGVCYLEETMFDMSDSWGYAYTHVCGSARLVAAAATGLTMPGAGATSTASLVVRAGTQVS